jgi:hypothetical protein
MARPRAFLTLIPAAVLCLTASSAATDRSYRDFEDVRVKALVRERRGEMDEAERLWEQVHAMAPDATGPILHLATIAGKEGRNDDALARLEAALKDGATDPFYLRKSVAFASLRKDARWDSFIAMLDSEYKQYWAQYRQRRVDLELSTATSFKSYRKLAVEFDRQARAFEDGRWRLSLAQSLAGAIALGHQRIAALHRYLAEHPQARDRVDARWDLIQTRLHPSYTSDCHDRMGEYGTQVLEEIDGFLRDFPADAHAGDASLRRALVVFATRPEGGTRERPWRDEDLIAFDRDLSVVATRFAGTTSGGFALALRLMVAGSLSPDRVTSAMRSMKADLDGTYKHNREVQSYLRDAGLSVFLRMTGFDRFKATDLGGTRWTASSFKGHVTLIEYWATWSDACADELPTLKTAFERFHAKGLNLLGVSVDYYDRKTFMAWLRHNDVIWPQIWDGKSWDTPMAKAYFVHSIPLMILLDREGRVAAVNLTGDELVDRVSRLVDETAPASRSEAGLPVSGALLRAAP